MSAPRIDRNTLLIGMCVLLGLGLSVVLLTPNVGVITIISGFAILLLTFVFAIRVGTLKRDLHNMAIERENWKSATGRSQRRSDRL